MPFPMASSPQETFQATGKAKAPEGTTWGRHPPPPGNGPPVGPQTGHTASGLHTGSSNLWQSQLGGLRAMGGKEAEVTDPEHRGERKRCQQRATVWQ